MMGNCGWFGQGMGAFGGLGIAGVIINLILTVGLIVGAVILIVWVVRRLSAGPATAQMGGSGPAEVLKLRYARGEITRDQYLQMAEDVG